MSNTVISVQNMGKSYRIGVAEKKPESLREALTSTLVSPFNYLRTRLKAATEAETIWALKDASFEVKQGESVGIIGHNGAGKSTLLKILTRITEPTTGRAVLDGRVASLLEVGTGFHPELTGRENIFLNGTILGMNRAEIARKFDEIVDFSGIEKFIDTPVKRYSSGMGVRLAFAVAAHLEAEILLIDEVLAVGDVQFQQKCLGKMSDIAGQGRTILFVSHNMTAVQSLCSRAIWLKNGSVAEDGEVGQVVSGYLHEAVSTRTERQWDEKDAPGNGTVQLHRANIHAEDDTPLKLVSTKTPLVVELEYSNFKPDALLHLVFTLYNEENVLIFNSPSFSERDWLNRPYPTGRYVSRCVIPGDLLNDGLHRVKLRVVENQRETIVRVEDLLVFYVNDANDMERSSYVKWSGVVRPKLDWETQIVTESQPAIVR